jgi:hypothetical protein
MTVKELREHLDNLDDDLLVVIPMTRDGDYEEESVGAVVKRDSMFGEGTIVALMAEQDL